MAIWVINSVEFTTLKTIKTLGISIQSRNLTILNVYIGFNNKQTSINLLDKQITELLLAYLDNNLIKNRGHEHGPPVTGCGE